LGIYSGYEGASLPPPGGSEQISHIEPVNNETYLRGRQFTDINGMVEFLTIYPGWYKLRTVHIHLKIFIDSKEVLTTQLFFPQELNYLIQSLPPYNINQLSPYINENDFILRESCGVQGGWPKITQVENMLIATLTIGIDVGHLRL
jgi:protocatechuate 3,4-dioxygenase beta subunit